MYIWNAWSISGSNDLIAHNDIEVTEDSLTWNPYRGPAGVSVCSLHRWPVHSHSSTGSSFHAPRHSWLPIHGEHSGPFPIYDPPLTPLALSLLPLVTPECIAYGASTQYQPPEWKTISQLTSPSSVINNIKIYQHQIHIIHQQTVTTSVECKASSFPLQIHL